MVLARSRYPPFVWTELGIVRVRISNAVCGLALSGLGALMLDEIYVTSKLPKRLGHIQLASQSTSTARL